MRRILKILTGRLVIVVPLVLLQFSAIVLLLYRTAIYNEMMIALNIIAVLMVIYIVNQQSEPSFKIAWIIILLAVPIVGIPLYLLSYNRKMPKKLSHGTVETNHNMIGLLTQDEKVVKASKTMDHEAHNIFIYGKETCGFPVYKNTSATYFKSGKEWFDEYIKQLKKAKHFIFIEYFIIDEGSVWDEILEVLKEKVKEGVEVCVIYDDFGSITMPWHYDKKLRKMGIEAYRFNHVRPIFIIQMNNRSHRKLTIIDNQVAFTGGVNLADEYVGRIERFGKWRDSAMMFEGDAVWAMTVMFLGLLQFERGEENVIDFMKYKIPCGEVKGDGYYQPFSDTPTDDEDVAFNIHMSLIKAARDYIYIDTPYLIPTEAIRNELILAAKSGVDVRIMTPHIPDKKLVFQITRANYEPLVKAGVKIYEYTEGFNHSKNFVSDDTLAVIGSVNMDYRSYYLHFENGVLMYQSEEITKMKKDFLDAQEKSELITIEKIQSTNIIVRMIRGVLNLFVPLL